MVSLKLTAEDELAWAEQCYKRNIGYAGTWTAVACILVLMWCSGVWFGYLLGTS